MFTESEEQVEQEQAEKRTEFAMQPAEMAQVLVDAVQEGKFYVLGYDDQQPLPWLKEMSTLRTEGIVQERAPLAHLAGDEEASGVSTWRSRLVATYARPTWPRHSGGRLRAAERSQPENTMRVEAAHVCTPSGPPSHGSHGSCRDIAEI